MPNEVLVQTPSGVWVQADAIARAHRADIPITFSSSPLLIATLGNRPSRTSLLDESTKGWAATAQRAISDRVASLRMLVGVEARTADGTTQLELLDDHPLQLVLDRPGPVFSRYSLLWLTSWHLGATGEAYWQRLNDGLGVTRELWPIPPDRVEILMGGPEVIRGYQVSDGHGRIVVLAPEEVVHFWRPDPRDLYAGLGALASQAVEWDADRYRIEAIKEHFHHNAVPPVVLKGQADANAPDDGVKDAFEQEWRNRYHRRLGRSQGVPAFIPPGWDIQELNALGQMTELAALGSASRDHILQSYGVPTSILGGSNTDQNRATAETNQYTFDRNTVSPITMLIEISVQEQLATAYDPRLRVNFEEFVAADKDYDLRREAQDLSLKVRTTQQILRDRGGDPEDAPWGELPVGSIADEPYTGEITDEPELEEADDVAAPPPKPKPMPMSPPPEPEMDDEDDDEPRTRSDRGETLQQAFWRLNVAAEKRFVGQFGRGLMRVWEQQRALVIRRLEQIFARSAGRVDASEVMNSEAGFPLFERVVEPIRRRAFKTAGQQALREVGVPGEFILVETMAATLEREALAMKINLNRTTLARLGRALAEATAAGESISQIVKRIDPIFRNRKRSRTVARTEIGRANQEGQIEGFDSSGVVERKMWNNSQDDKVRDSHEIDGQVVGLRESFTLDNGVEAQHPLDPELPAEDAINCRCFVTPVLEGEE